MGMNRVELIGRLGADPELKFTPKGIAVAKLSVATTESTGFGEDRKETTEWHSVVVWRGRAEACAKEMRKGDEISIVGKLTSRSYKNKDDVNVKVTEVVATDIYRLKSLTRENKGDNRGGDNRGPSNYIRDTRTGRDPGRVDPNDGRRDGHDPRGGGVDPGSGPGPENPERREGEDDFPW
jgi:single-strand DNA-binding protein